MPLDMRTLAFILGLLHVLQIVVFGHQFLTNKSHRGIGWWLAWCVAETAGFAAMLLRDIPTIGGLALFLQNTLIVGGVVFLYLGITRFLDRKTRIVPIVAGYGLCLAGLFYTSLIHEDIELRSFILGLALSSYSLLTAGVLLSHRRRAPGSSSGLLTAAFLSHALYFGARNILIISGYKIAPIFVPDAFNSASMLDGLAMAVLWTVGLILLINRRLTAEMTEAKEHFELIFNTSPDPTLITGLLDGRIRAVNDAFSALIGYSREESLGRSSLEARIWDDPEDRAKVVEELRRTGFCRDFEAGFRTRSGAKIVGIMSAKIIQLAGVPHIISVTRDITMRKQAEDRIKSLLREKELLLKEVHHRVKNNISAMMSLLSLQAAAAAEERTAEALKAARERMRSMALLYDRLYRAEVPLELSIADYLPSLIDEIVAVFPKAGPVRVEKKIEDFVLEARVLSPLGIIINELLTNALKYAFVGRTGGAITVTASGRVGRVILTVADDGVGLPEAGAHVRGFGLQLVDMLTAQLDGTLHVDRGGGTRFVLDFPSGRPIPAPGGGC